MNSQYTVVVSAINISNGGPLTVLNDCLMSASEQLPKNWKIIALVNNKNMINIPRVKFLEFPLSKKFWILRLFYEWAYFYSLSKKIKSDIWVSLHDITPLVKAKKQFVYCHNPSPFYKILLKDFIFDQKFFLFNLLYIFLYKVNIKKNSYIVVQQEWLRKEFKKKFDLANVIVAHPCTTKHNLHPKNINLIKNTSNLVRSVKFLYPAFPRVFKNFEVICDAFVKLDKLTNIGIELKLTISGKENLYARYLHYKYSKYTNIKFIGLQTRDQMNEEYSSCDVVLFPSKLETWGLPISEAISFNKPLFVADLPYAHESVSKYDKVYFINAFDSEKWVSSIVNFLNQTHVFKMYTPPLPTYPFAENWDKLWEFFVRDINK